MKIMVSVIQELKNSIPSGHIFPAISSRWSNFTGGDTSNHSHKGSIKNRNVFTHRQLFILASMMVFLTVLIMDRYQTFATAGGSGSIGDYVDNGDGTISDKKAGLMWTQKDSFGDSGSYQDWNTSRAYVKTLRLGGHADWRMPTTEELKSLYDMKYNLEGAGGMMKIHLCPIFSPGAAFSVWSSEEQTDCCAKYFNFVAGYETSANKSFSPGMGVRAVRKDDKKP